MLAGPAFAGVVDHAIHVLKRTWRIGPQVRAVCFLVARLEHRHRGFVGMQHTVPKQRLPQGIDQRLQLHAALAQPGAER